MPKHKEQTCLQETCSFFVTHKKRYCRMLAARGKKYCGQHLVADQTPDEDGHIRIPCPLDVKHSVYQHQLQQHLLVCNAREPTHLPYYRKNRNCGLLQEKVIKSPDNFSQIPNICSHPRLSLSGKSIAELSDEELLLLIEIVTTSEKEHTEPITAEELLHHSMQEHLPKDSPSLCKLLLQNASLVAHLGKICAFVEEQVHLGCSTNLQKQNVCETDRCQDKINRKHSVVTSAKDCKILVKETEVTERKERACVLEFGAGKGQLSHWVASASNSQHDLQLVLIDRGAPRYKFDTRISEKCHVSQQRLRVDIADLALECTPGLDLSGKVYAGGKHLCGAATDLALRCLVNGGVFHSSAEPGTRGLVIALCCHHRCDWQHYTGKHFLEGLGLGHHEFLALLGLTSWAVCAARPPAPAAVTDGGNISAPSANGAATNNRVGATNSLVEDKECVTASESNSDVVSNGYDGRSVTTTPTSASEQNALCITSSVTKDELKQGPALPRRDTGTVAPSPTAEPSALMDDRLNSGDNLESHCHDPDDVTAHNRYARLGLSIATREAVGRAAKHLLDHGRLLHVRELGMKARLVYYVGREVTLENVALVAHN